MSSITKDKWQWDRLCAAASAVRKERGLSDSVACGAVSAAVLSGSGKIYAGVCVDARSALGICAERNSVFRMIAGGEQEIKKLSILLPDGSSGAPRAGCREMTVQLMPDKDQGIEMMPDRKRERIMTPGGLRPAQRISPPRR